jgi:hypothetical protein
MLPIEPFGLAKYIPNIVCVEEDIDIQYFDTFNSPFLKENKEIFNKPLKIDKNANEILIEETSKHTSVQSCQIKTNLTFVSVRNFFETDKSSLLHFILFQEKLKDISCLKIIQENSILIGFYTKESASECIHKLNNKPFNYHILEAKLLMI